MLLKKLAVRSTNTMQKWLNRGKHTLVCNPFPEYSVTESSVDRSKIPALGPQKAASFHLEGAKLSNGW